MSACRSAWGLVLVSLLSFAPTLARAEVWGYVDARGVAHLAAEKLDDRYELFSRGSPSFAVGELAGESRGSAKGEVLAEPAPTTM